MIKKFLKAAGVKTKEEFYKKYPTEAAFFKAHPEMKKMRGGGEQKKLNQLTNFTNDVDGIMPTAQDGESIGAYYDVADKEQVDPMPFRDMYNYMYYDTSGVTPMERIAQQEYERTRPSGFEEIFNVGDAKSAKKGKQIPRAQTGWQNTMWGQTGNIPVNPNAPTTYNVDPNQAGPSQQMGLNNSPLGTMPNPGNAPTRKGMLDKLGGPMGVANVAGDIISAARQMKEDRNQMNQAKKFSILAGLTEKAAGTRPEQVKRKYVRPEDVTVNPNELFPTYGVGTNYLAQDGAVVNQIGGNPTEIQNTYAPGTLYDNLGYEPIEESEMLKQYAHGGIMKAPGGINLGGFGNFMGQVNTGVAGGVGAGLGSLFGGGGFRQTGAGQLGSAIGSTVGKVLPIPGASQVLGLAGGLVGGIFGGKTARQTERFREQGEESMNRAAMNYAGQNLQNQYSSFMEDGGWVSHDWQPQVIAKFGEHNMKDLLRRDPMMDTLRTGGNLRRNETDMNGDLTTHWGGSAESFSYNPYLPDGGETVMFKGQSHDESDGRGNTGIGVTYGDNPVEVERNEPAVKLKDGTSGESSLVVYGNLKIPNMFLDQIGDPKAKGMKFKHYIRDLSKEENKQNKKLENVAKTLSETDIRTPFGRIAASSGQAIELGVKMTLKDIAEKKMNAAAVQNAINDTADELGLIADDLAKGKIKVDKKKAKEDAAERRNPQTAQEGGIFDMLNPINIAGRGLINLFSPPPPYDPTRTLSEIEKRNQQAGVSQTSPTQAPSSVAATDLQAQLQANLDRALGSQTPDATQASSSATPPRKKGVSVQEPKKSDFKTNDEYLEALYDVAKKQKRGRVVEKFQEEYHKAYPDFAKQVISEYEPTAKAVQEGLTNEDLEGNVDGIFGKRTIRYKQLMDQSRKKAADIPASGVQVQNVTPVDKKTVTKRYTTPVEEKPKKFTWADAASQLMPYLMPTDIEELDPRQLYGEMFALASNQQDAVQAQQYAPLLEQPFDISYQDRLNEITAQTRALERLVPNNPSALASLHGEARMAKDKVLAEQFRDNMVMKAGVYNRNRQTLNDAFLKNIEIFDRQYVRQAQAKANTKAVAQAALNSMSEKIARNKLENRELQVYENMYNYRYDPNFRARNFNIFNPNIPNVGKALVPIYDGNGNIVGYQSQQGAVNQQVVEETVETVPPPSPATQVPVVPMTTGQTTTQRRGGKTPKNSMIVKSLKSI